MDNFEKTGFNIFEMGPDEWGIEHIGIKTFVGSFKEVIIFAAIKFHLNMNEIDSAIQCMVQLDENTAHFSENGYFKYTFNKSFQEFQRAI